MSETQPEPAQPVDIGELVREYIAAREWLRKLEKAYDKAKEEKATRIQQLTAAITAALEASGVNSAKTPHGTCYTSTQYKVSLADPDAFMNYVITNNKFELLDRKANVTAVRDFVTENASLPPGVNLSAISTVGVRAPTKKA